MIGGATVRAFLFVSVCGLSAVAEDWPGWRGPHGNGVSGETGIVTEFGPDKNVAWKTPIPGRGYSSPIVVGDRVFLTTCIEKEGKRVLMCLDRHTGKPLWDREVSQGPTERIHNENSHASCTPVSDGKFVYVNFLKLPDYVVACYDFEGKEIWKKTPGKFFSKHGYGAGPILHNNLLILNLDQDPAKADFPQYRETPADAYLLALDKTTGNEVWRAPRENITRSYCVPIIIEAAGKKQLVLSGSKCVAAYDPDTGKRLWIIDGPTEQFVASPVYTDDTLFLNYGFPKLGMIAIRPDGAGDVTKTHVLWNEKGGGYVPSPIAAGKLVFSITDGGVLYCVEVKTGKRLWSQRLGGRKTHSSPVSVGDNLYFSNDDGVITILKAAETYQQVNRIEMGEDIFASPAVSHGQLFIRTAKHLWCFGIAKE